MSGANWLDRAVSVFAPGSAFRRLQNRQAFDLAARKYDGAARGRNTSSWNTTNTSADAETHLAGSLLRDRHRDLVRNNAHAAKAVSVLANNIVGDGIIARPNTGDDKLDTKIKVLFEEWSAQCDFDNQLDFYGLQTLAVREMIEGGEVLCRRSFLELKKSGMNVPLQLQLLEGDFFDDSRTGDFGKGTFSINGVEFDINGKRLAYWLWEQHPGNNYVLMQKSVLSHAVPASEIIHLYEKQRTQVRGVPWGAPVIRDMRDLSDYEFAELQRKKMESSVVGIISGDTDFTPETQGIGSRVRNSRGEIVENLQSGSFLYTEAGKTVTFNSPAVIAGYGEYKKSILRTIAAGYRIPYELLSGDLADVNFSSIRAGIVEFRRFVKHVQWHILIPMFLQPAWDWFTEAAFLAGKIPTPMVPVVWGPPKFEWVDPEKDVQAEILAIRSGIRSFQDVAADHGLSMEELLDEIEAFNEMLDKRKLTLDSDPRQVSQLGVAQKSDPQTPGVAPKQPPENMKPAPSSKRDFRVTTFGRVPIQRDE